MGGFRPPWPERVFEVPAWIGLKDMSLNDSKALQDDEMKFCHFNFTPLRHALHTLTMLIDMP